jgi:tetratricopeptide (TPR) repeat protein
MSGPGEAYSSLPASFSVAQATRPHVFSYTGRLSPEERRVLSYASAIGREFDPRLLAAAMGIDSAPLSSILEILVSQGFLRSLENGRYAFVLDEIWGAIYRELTESRARVIHRKIGLALEALEPHPSPAVIYELGRHFYLGQVPDRSVTYNLRAADAAELAFSPEAAAHHLQRARTHLHALPGDHSREEGEILLREALLYLQISDSPRAEKLMEQALRIAGTSDPVLRGLLLLARGELWRREVRDTEAEESVNEAHRLFDTLGNIRGHAGAHRLLSRIWYARGNYTRAAEDADKAVRLLERETDPRGLGSALVDLGNVLATSANPASRERARRSYRRAIEILQQLRDPSEVSRAFNNLGVTWLDEDRPEEALEAFLEARKYADLAHDRRRLAWALFNSVEAYLKLGQMDEAERINNEARTLAEQIGDRIALIQVGLNDGIISESCLELESAERSYQEAAELCRRLGREVELSEMELRLANLYLGSGQMGKAREALARAEEHNVDVYRPNLAWLQEKVRRGLGLPARPAPLAANQEPA